MLTKVIISSLLTQSVGALLFGGVVALKPGVEQQLRAQYAVTRVGANGAVLQAGQVLVVQLDGIKASPTSLGQGYLPNSYKKDERVRQSVKSKVWHMPLVPGLSPDRALQVAEKVYLTNIQIKDEEIVFSVQSCGVCNPAVADPAPFRASLAFQFAKGYLETADYNAIQDMIGKVFAIDTSPPQSIPTELQQPSTLPNQPIEQPAQLSPPSQAPTPVTIQMGDTIDQVVAAMGQPDRKAKIGNKDIYSYKDMKITFVDGKVSDIQ